MLVRTSRNPKHFNQCLQKPPPIRVVTFNTGEGNRAIRTAARDYLKLPFYREVISGRPDAPIVALQEVSGAQANALLREAARTRQFGVVRSGPLVLLVPKRFELRAEDARGGSLKRAQVNGVLRSVWRAASRLKLPDRDELGQWIEMRPYLQVRLVDRMSGRGFSVFNAHLSGHPPLKVEQAEQLLSKVGRAQREAPVILAGDLNAVIPNTPHRQLPSDKAMERLVGAYGLTEMSLMPLPTPRRRDLDWVLARGFIPEKTRYYAEQFESLPGAPEALEVSDHLAKETTLRLATRYRPRPH